MAKWIIDAGHGGKDAGAVGKDGTKEKDLTLKISLYQFKRLQELGVNVQMTRVSDITLEPNNRVKKVNDLGGSNDYCISNHINAGGGTGVETIHSIHSESTIATKLANAVVQASGLPFRKVYSRKNERGNDYYFMHRETKPHTVIIEYGFIDNEKDLNVLKTKWETIAESVVKTICEIEGVKYVAPKKVEEKPKTNKLYRVQVGAFSDEAFAEKLANELKAKGYPAVIKED